MKTLLATDGSTDTHAAFNFLKRVGLPDLGEVTLLTVVQPIRGYAHTERERLAVQEIAGAACVEAQKMLESEAELLKDQNWRIQTAVRQGHISEEIIAAAEESQSELIVIGARGRSRLRRFLLGGVSQRIAKYAPCSVLVTRGAHDQAAETDATRRTGVRVLLAYDDSGSSQMAVDWLASLPLDDLADVTLLTVLPEITDETERQRKSREIDEQNAQAALQRVEARLKSLTPNVRSVLQESGDVSRQILETAEQLNTDLIVLGHKGKSGVERFLLGSVSNRVMVHANCHVCVVR